MRGSRLLRTAVNRYGLGPHAEVDETIMKLTTTFRNHFVDSLKAPRMVGREAEFPVVNAKDGTAGDVRKVLAELDAEGDMKLKQIGDVGLFGPEYEYSLEVGTGTVEVITGPFENLHDLKEVHERAVFRLARAAHKLDMRVLGFGVQPITPPDASLLSPRKRYETMLNVMGPVWNYFTITASDQIHVDICEPELLRQINLSNLLCPAMVALNGNSSIVGGEVGPAVSMREYFGHEIGPRHSMAPGPFYSVVDYISYLCRTPMLLRPPNQVEKWEGQDSLVAVEDGTTFYDKIAESGFDWGSFLVHDHYVWNAGRPRVAQGTIEIRPICQQPWADHMVVPALCLGAVDAAAAIVADKDLRHALDWVHQRTLQTNAVRAGLATDVAGMGIPMLEFLRRLLDLSSAALEARGMGEEVYLKPLYERLDRKMNPGQQAVNKFLDEGIQGLIEHTRIRLPEED